MTSFREQIYVENVPRSIECILGADIGGTNSNFGIFQEVEDKLVLLVSLHAKSQKIFDFPQVVKDVLDYAEKNYAITIKQCAFAAAGVSSKNKDFVKPTNLSFSIDIKDIIQRTALTCAFVVNDFEVIGYGLNVIAKKDLIQVNNVIGREQANKVILGSGTGLGKSILIWNSEKNKYISLASEGGHADFSAQTELELEFINFIRSSEKISCNISWENVLSGKGIQRMYAFFRHKNSEAKADTNLVEHGLHPDEIFKNRNLDEHSGRTFELYAKLYARCAKNFALDGLALGGVYIAGGIATHNLPMFRLPCFMKEFINCGKKQKLLEQIPVYIIADYDVSLYGAAEMMRLEYTT